VLPGKEDSGFHNKRLVFETLKARALGINLSWMEIFIRA